MTAKYIIGAIIILVFLVWGSLAFFQSTVQYVSIEEASKTTRTVQVMGKIDFESIHYDQDSSRLEFAIYDAEAASPATAERLPAVYFGVPPGNFEQATSVVLKGKPDESGIFIADQMLVKCPSKYQGDGTEYQDGRKHDEGVAAEAE